jgi:hypothetical protein
MDKHLLYLQFLFIITIFIYLFIEKNYFLKILFLVLTFLFFLKEQGSYVYNKDKYLYVGYGFTGILILFFISEFITHIYFLVFFMCAVVLYLYLYKVLFNTTYGVVLESTTKNATIKIKDSFYRRGKEFTLKYSKKIPTGKTVLLELSKNFVDKKPIKIKKIIKNE